MDISSEKSIRITWGALGCSIVVLVTIVVWLSATDNKASAAVDRLNLQREAIHKLQDRDVLIDEKLTKIYERTSRIEGLVELLIKKAGP